jgi:ABC-type multidrug transport system fused ATPase/permease subunit
MVIQDGQLRAFGTPAELASNDGFYKEALHLAALR